MLAAAPKFPHCVFTPELVSRTRQTAGKQLEIRSLQEARFTYLGESQSGTGNPSESYSAPPVVCVGVGEMRWGVRLGGR